MSNQMALSVGEPVKNRETSELNEWVALMPIIVRIAPTTRSAIDKGLFICSWSAFHEVHGVEKGPIGGVSSLCGGPHSRSVASIRQKWPCSSQLPACI